MAYKVVMANTETLCRSIKMRHESVLVFAPFTREWWVILCETFHGKTAKAGSFRLKLLKMLVANASANIDRLYHHSIPKGYCATTLNVKMYTILMVCAIDRTNRNTAYKLAQKKGNGSGSLGNRSTVCFARICRKCMVTGMRFTVGYRLKVKSKVWGVTMAQWHNTLNGT